jgi:hypothetical protein
MSQFGMVDQLLTKAFLPGYGPKHGGMPARWWAVGKFGQNSEVTKKKVKQSKG